MKAEEVASVLDDQEVDGHDDDPDNEEHRVIEEAFADVKFVVDLSSSDHVDNLEPDEQVKDEGHVTGGIFVSSGPAIFQLNLFGCTDIRSIINRFIEFIAVNLVESTWEHHFVHFNIEVALPVIEA